MKVHPIHHVSFETTTSRFIQILRHCLVLMKYNSSVFFYLRPLYFRQKEPVEVKFSDLSGWVKIQQIP